MTCNIGVSPTRVMAGGRGIHIQTGLQRGSLGAAPQAPHRAVAGPCTRGSQARPPVAPPASSPRQQCCLIISSPASRLPAWSRAAKRSPGAGGLPDGWGGPCPSAESEGFKAGEPAALRAGCEPGHGPPRTPWQLGELSAVGLLRLDLVTRLCADPSVGSACTRLFPGVPPHQCVPLNLLLLP